MQDSLQKNSDAPICILAVNQNKAVSVTTRKLAFSEKTSAMTASLLTRLLLLLLLNRKEDTPQRAPVYRRQCFEWASSSYRLLLEGGKCRILPPAAIVVPALPDRSGAALPPVSEATAKKSGLPSQGDYIHITLHPRHFPFCPHPFALALVLFT